MSTTWGQNSWGDNSWNSNVVTTSLTGVEATTSIGSVDAFPLQGWSRQQWGNSGWGVEYSVAPSGFSATTSVGSVVAAQFIIPDIVGVESTTSLGSISINTVVIPTGIEATVSLGQTEESNQRGWGRLSWGTADWGEGRDETISLSGFEITASIGSITPVFTYLLEVGPAFKMTGQVGSVGIGLGVELSGVEATFATPVLASTGTLTGWGRDAWGDHSWGESPNVVLGLVGIQSTISVGSR